MSLAMEATQPGKNYARTSAGLIRLCENVVITAQVPRALTPLTTNLSALCAPFTPCRNDTRQGYFLRLPPKPLFLL